MGAPHYTVALQKIAAEQGLTVLHAAQDYATREIRTADVNRPGLQLAGFYNYFDPERLQIIGRVESTYLETLTPDQRRERFEQFMRYNIIGLVHVRRVHRHDHRLPEPRARARHHAPRRAC